MKRDGCDPHITNEKGSISREDTHDTIVRKRKREEEAQPCKKIHYLDPIARKKHVSSCIEKLQEETGCSWKVIFHSLLIYSGDLEKARIYLLKRGGSRHFSSVLVLDTSQLHDKPWTAQEDETLTSNKQAAIATVIKERGNQETQDRINFLCSISYLLNTYSS